MTARLRVGVVPCQPVAMLGRQGSGAMLELLDRPSIMLVMRGMTTVACACSR